MSERHSTNIDLTQLAQQARAASTYKLTALIKHHQEQLVEKLCGPKYSRGHPYRRGSAHTKKLTTSLGEIRFKARRVIDRRSGRAHSPILKTLDVERRRYSQRIHWACIDHASRMSYAKASRCIQAATGVKIPRRTIHRWVNELTPRLLGEALSRGEYLISEASIVMGDSTAVRGLQRREMRHARVLTDGHGGLLALRVDEPWPLGGGRRAGLRRGAGARGGRDGWEASAVLAARVEASGLHPVEGWDG